MNAVNDAPSFAKGPDQSAPEDSGPMSVEAGPRRSAPGPPDEAGQSLSFLVTNVNNGLFSSQPAIDATTGTLTYTPAANAYGSALVSVQLQDNGGTANGGSDTSAAQTFTIVVSAVNDPPVLASPGNQEIDEQATLGFSLSASDPDVPPDSLTFTILSGAVMGMSLDPSSGAFSWTPTETQDANYSVTFKVADSAGAFDTKTISITVNEVNQADVGDLPNTVEVVKTVARSFTAVATDADRVLGVMNTLSYSLIGAPITGVSLNSSTGAFAWTPTEDQGPGDYLFTVRVTDNGNPILSTDAVLTVQTLAAGIVGNNLLIVGTSGADKVSIDAADREAVAVTFIDEEPLGPFSIPAGGKIIAKMFAGNDTLSISGVVDADINMGQGDDDSTEDGDVTYQFSDPGGNDTYTFHGSTVVVTDDGGSDSYTEAPSRNLRRPKSRRRKRASA